MNDQQKKEQSSSARDQEIRAALDQHWAASDANDFETEHRIYDEYAVLEYPQSGERTRGRRNIQHQRASQPSKKRFAVRRILGGGEVEIVAHVPTSEVLRYAIELRSMTGGRGRFTMEHSHYDPVPAHVVDKVVAGAKEAAAH